MNKKIYLIRGYKVMLDRDLAELYGIQVKRLNEAVKRNIGRFPSDFMFKLTEEDGESLRSQFATANKWLNKGVKNTKPGRGGARNPPLVFTELGIAMLSSVLNTEKAVQINIRIMRAFQQLRDILASHKELKEKIELLEYRYDGQFELLFKTVKQLIEEEEKPKEKIGFRTNGLLKKTLFTIIFCISLFFSSYVSAATVLPEFFEGDLRLEKTGSPYSVPGSGIFVEEGNNLIIDPGVTILFAPRAGLFVEGGNLKIGDNPISFENITLTVDPDLVTESNQHWVGIYGQGNFILTGVSIEEADVALFLKRQSSVTISGLTINGYASAIDISDSEVKIEGLFVSNILSVAVILERVTGFLKDSIIFKNDIGIEVTNSPSFSIFNNTITQNNQNIVVYSNTLFNAGNNFWGDDVPISGEFVNFLPILTSSPQGFYPCCSSILFFPGFQGSRLYQGDNQLWEPNWNSDAEKLYLDDSGRSINSDISVGDIIKITNVGLGIFDRPIYQGVSDLFDSLVTSGKIQSWKAVPYDWRLDLPISSSEVYRAIRELAWESKTGKVILVGHSNGGLMIKKILSSLDRYTQRRLDKAILVATPQIGAPQAIGSLLHGDDQQIAGGLILKKSTARSLGKNMPGAYNLLPSTPLYSTSTAFIRFASSTDIVSNLRQVYGDAIFSPGAVSDFLSGLSDQRQDPSRSNTNLPAVLKRDFLDVAEDEHDVLDGLIYKIPVLQIGATGFPTTESLDYSAKKSCLVTTIPFCAEKNELIHKAFKKTDGDGTVPLRSALFTNDPKVLSYVFDIGAYNTLENKNYSHADILEILPIKDLIKDIITGYPHWSPYSYVSGKPVFQYDVYFPAAVDAYDEDGIHTGPIVLSDNQSDLSLIEANIPNSVYEQDEYGTHITIAEPKKPIRIRSGPKQSGKMNVEITKTVDDTVETIVSFEDVPVEEGSVVEIVTDPATSTTPVMTIDQDDDGVIDEIIDPTPEPEYPAVPEEDEETEVEDDDGNSGSDHVYKNKETPIAQIKHVASNIVSEVINPIFHTADPSEAEVIVATVAPPIIATGSKPRLPETNNQASVIGSGLGSKPSTHIWTILLILMLILTTLLIVLRK